MARLYTAQFTEVAATAQQDLFQIEAVTVPANILSVSISQTSDVADAAAENLSIIIRRVTDALTNVTTEQLLDAGDAAALADLNVNDTTELTTGAATLFSEAWNIAFPYIWNAPVIDGKVYPIVVPVGDVVVVNLNTTPADSLTISGTLVFYEAGS